MNMAKSLVVFIFEKKMKKVHQLTFAIAQLMVATLILRDYDKKNKTDSARYGVIGCKKAVGKQ